MIIVFVHGILSSGEDAWGRPSWPDLLAAEPELDGAGIFVFTYQTGLWSRTYGIADVADFLREHLRLSDLLSMRKIVFVCHSMGGIAVRRFLVANQRELIAANPLIGLFLVASPSLGSRDANMLSVLSFALQHTQAAALRFSQANTSLDELHRDFRTLLSGRELQIEGRELIEDRPIAIKRWLGLRRQIVEPFAASQYFHKAGCEPFRVPGSDHASIVKPVHSGAVQHLMLKKFIREFVLPYPDDSLRPVQEIVEAVLPPASAVPADEQTTLGNDLTSGSANGLHQRRATRCASTARHPAGRDSARPEHGSSRPRRMGTGERPAARAGQDDCRGTAGAAQRAELCRKAPAFGALLTSDERELLRQYLADSSFADYGALRRFGIEAMLVDLNDFLPDAPAESDSAAPHMCRR